jgi:predicted transcriptional regulator of viral defense system
MQELIHMSRHIKTSGDSSKRQQILELARKAGVLRPRDVEAVGISGEYLHKLFTEGVLERRSRGLYSLPDAEFGENIQLAEIAKRVPKAVVCLLSALRFHELTTQAPHQIWIAIGEKARSPRIEYPPIHVVRFAEAPLHYGVQIHPIDGVEVKVYSPAKTVTDCFKFRRQIGTDVALEALRDCWRQQKATIDELWAAAKVCRMSNIIRPYLESLL